MVFSDSAFDHHEVVEFVSDPASGLRAIIAVHSTALGPAAGGCRFWSYATGADALHDALRLSRGMSYKNALADIPFGGGKAVILAPQTPFNREALFTAYGRAVERLGGRYVTAEDVGTSVSDMMAVARQTCFVSGIGDVDEHGATTGGGDPSPHTALGIFHGVQAAVAARLGRGDLAGVRIAVQGLGNVGFNLCTLLHNAGAVLTVADVRDESVRRAVETFGATACTPEAILAADVDVVSPCALGAGLTRQSIPTLKASIVAGGANNQLETDADGDLLQARNILYAPDYVINAGGIISVALEYLDTYDAEDLSRRLAGIGARLSGIFAEAQRTGKPTNVLADAMAQARIAGARPGERAAA